MERRWVRWLRVAGGVALLAVALVAASSIAGTLVSTLVPCDTTFLILCLRSVPPPPPDWTPVVALATVGVALLWPRRQTGDESVR